MILLACGAANSGRSRLFSRRAPRRNAAAANICRPTPTQYGSFVWNITAIKCYVCPAPRSPKLSDTCQGCHDGHGADLVPWAAVHVLYVSIIVLADVFVHFFVGLPADQPTSGPRRGVRARIVDRCFVLQRVV